MATTMGEGAAAAARAVHRAPGCGGERRTPTIELVTVEMFGARVALAAAVELALVLALGIALAVAAALLGVVGRGRVGRTVVVVRSAVREHVGGRGGEGEG